MTVSYSHAANLCHMNTNSRAACIQLLPPPLTMGISREAFLQTQPDATLLKESEYFTLYMVSPAQPLRLGASFRVLPISAYYIFNTYKSLVGVRMILRNYDATVSQREALGPYYAAYSSLNETGLQIDRQEYYADPNAATLYDCLPPLQTKGNSCQATACRFEALWGDSSRKGNQLKLYLASYQNSIKLVLDLYNYQGINQNILDELYSLMNFAY